MKSLPCRSSIVITSYSIHYTKLYDTPWSDGEGYFSYYGLDSLSGERACDYSGYGEQSLWTWSVSPSRPRGTVVFLHGYLDHSALSLALFAFLNDRGYRIVAYDLPGHGLSGGQRAGLEDFDQYVITSYSIHYTKLYDPFIQKNFVKGAALGAIKG